MESRIEEVERTNGRLTVRVEELEDQLFLLNDRVESHRIALQRRAYDAKRDGAIYAQGPRAPRPAPESYYQGGAGYDSYNVAPRKPTPRRPVRRIPLSGSQQVDTYGGDQVYDEDARQVAVDDEPEREIVITDTEFREFSGEAPEPERAPAKRESAPAHGRMAQPDVTSEKLSTSDTNSAEAPAQEKSPEPASAPTSTGLRLYKDSLAAYRAGNYDVALAGFEAFLDSQPKQDYVDNALYWIGECHYGLGHFGQAVTHFERVLKEQPDGNKVPDSMLKMSLALDRVGDTERATRVLESLTQRYPMTNAAQLGKKRLAQRP